MVKRFAFYGQLQYWFFFFCCGIAAAGTPDFTVTVGTDLLGGDYKSAELAKAEPKLCQEICANDPKCAAFTYVKPGIKGPKAVCFLKSEVPASTADQCCLSGVKKSSSPGVQQTTPQKMEVHLKEGELKRVPGTEMTYRIDLALERIIDSVEAISQKVDKIETEVKNLDAYPSFDAKCSNNVMTLTLCSNAKDCTNANFPCDPYVCDKEGKSCSSKCNNPGGCSPGAECVTSLGNALPSPKRAKTVVR